MKTRRRNNGCQSRQQSIGIAGAHAGIGCTHLAMTIAYYMASTGEKTALVSRNEQEELEQFAQTNGRERTEEGYYEYQRIHYYSYDNNQLFSGYVNAGYAVVVFDFGSEWERHQEDFWCCTHKILMLDGAPWKRTELMEQLKQLGKEHVSQACHYLLTGGDNLTMRMLKRKFSFQFQSYGYAPNPWRPDQQTIDVLHRIINR